MARMNPLKKYAVGMAAIAAVSGGIGMAQTFIKHAPTPTTPVAQVQTATPVVQPAVDTVQEPVVQQPVMETPVVQQPVAKISTETMPSADDAYVAPAESEDDYVWVDEHHDREDSHEDEDQYEGGGYDE